MAIAVGTTKQTLANAWYAIGSYIALCTGDPGSPSSQGAPANETSGSGYARQSTTWTAGSGGSVTGSQVTIPAPAATFTYVAFCVGLSSATMFDKASISSTQLTNPGNVLVTPSFTVT